MAGIEAMRVGSEENEDEVVDGKIVVRLPDDRKSRIVETGERDRVEVVEEKSLVRMIPVSPRSEVQIAVVGERVRSGPSTYFTKGRGGMGRGQDGGGVA